jgi:hypothetical protein
LPEPDRPFLGLLVAENELVEVAIVDGKPALIGVKGAVVGNAVRNQRGQPNSRLLIWLGQRTHRRLPRGAPQRQAIRALEHDECATTVIGSVPLHLPALADEVEHTELGQHCQHQITTHRLGLVREPDTDDPPARRSHGNIARAVESR